MTREEFHNYRFGVRTLVKVFNLEGEKWLNITEVDFERETVSVGAFVIAIHFIKEIKEQE